MPGETKETKDTKGTHRETNETSGEPMMRAGAVWACSFSLSVGAYIIPLRA